MYIKDAIQSATSSLLVNRTRSFLTVLGIVIGIASIMIVMSVGDSAKGLIENEISIFGPELVTINPGSPSDSPFGASSVLSDALKLKDVEDLKRKSNVPEATQVIASVIGGASASYESETISGIIWGTESGAFDLYQLPVGEGRIFTDEEVATRAEVIIIGKKIADELFGVSSPIGQKIKIKNKTYRVIGTFGKTSWTFLNTETMMMMPYTTAQQYVLGIRHFQEIVLRASSVDTVPAMVADIEQTLRENHKIDNPDKDDFIIQTQEDVMETVGGILNAITIFLGLVAALSLLVGGVGVMNIMFVSITERTREIGLRKSLGATRRDILTQFLFEAIFLTGFGGIAGVVVGTTMGALIALGATFFTGIQFPPTFSLLGALLVLVVSGGIGLIFGVFPARHAAKKSPVEALRYE